jgi:DNA-binding transcriptional regulator YiaG
LLKLPRLSRQDAAPTDPNLVNSGLFKFDGGFRDCSVIVFVFRDSIPKFILLFLGAFALDNFFLTMLTSLAKILEMEHWSPEDIKKLREKQNLSQKAFGEFIGVSRNYVYYLERGEREPNKTLRLLLDCIEEKLKRMECD